MQCPALIDILQDCSVSAPVHPGFRVQLRLYKSLLFIYSILLFYKIGCPLFGSLYQCFFITEHLQKSDRISAVCPALTELIWEADLIIFDPFLKMIILICIFQKASSVRHHVWLQS